MTTTRTVMLLMALTLAQARAGQPFGIQVVEEGSQRGISMAVLETENHIRMVTDSAGWVVFDEPGLMGRLVRFTATSAGYALPKDDNGQPFATLSVHAGRQAEVRLVRTSIAERLYRTTGQGIYRNATILGKDVPLPFPNLNGEVLGNGTAQSAFYEGKLFWVWPDVRSLSLPHPVITGATADLPGEGGLEAVQGVHLRYFMNDNDEPQPLLAVPAGSEGRLDGLASVRDAAGAEHLIAHYSLLRQGRLTEQGLAEYGSRGHFDRKVVLGDEYAWQFPHGHAVLTRAETSGWLYFADPFCHVRVPASYEAVMNPGNYQALTWSEDEERYVWQQAAEPLTATAEAKLVKNRSAKATPALCLPADVAGSPGIVLKDGSVQWNDFRQRWIMIAASTVPGDIWYAESSQVTGPWRKAVLIATHPGLSLSGVLQQPRLAHGDDRYVYFEGTCSSAAPAAPLPRYEGTQIMYRLDLKDQRLEPAHEKQELPVVKGKELVKSDAGSR